jgi:hypothetical protein
MDAALLSKLGMSVTLKNPEGQIPNMVGSVGRRKGAGAGLPKGESFPLEERVVTFWSRVAKGEEDDCWNWLGPKDKDGYGRFAFRGKVVLCHRFAWFATLGSWPKAPYLCHRCDNPSCVNPKHLFEGDAYTNNHDAIKKGRVRHWGRPRLKPEQVLKIRSLYGTGEFSYTTLAATLNLPRTTIFSALHKWKTLSLYGRYS